ncbi:hypothetical protein ABPG74_022122 [Tetrahymena malaccensis]
MQSQSDAPNKQEMVEQLLAEMAPEITKEIVKELRDKYENQFQEEVQLLKLKAKQSCESIVEEKIEEIYRDQLQEYKKRKGEQEEKQKELNFLKLNVMTEVEASVHEKCMQQLEEEKEKLLKKFNEEHNSNKKQTQLEKEINERIALEFKEQKTFEIQRKEKLLKLNYKKKFEEEKEHLQKEYQNNIDQDFEKQMQQIEQQRAKIAKATAANNLKVQQSKEERQLLLQEKKDMDKEYNSMISQLQQDLQNLKQELEQLQQQQQQQQMQQQQQILMSSDKKQQKAFNKEYEQDQRYLHLRQQQEDDQCYNYDDQQHVNVQNDNINQDDLLRRNNLFSQTQSNMNDYFNQINNSQIPYLEEPKMGLTTQLFNTNQLQNTKSPFLLSLTNKLNLNQTNVDHNRIMQQFEESQKIMPAGINLLAPPQPIFLPNGEKFISREKNNLFEQQENDNKQEQQVHQQSTFQPLKEYNTADLAAKLLNQIQENKQSNQQLSMFNKLPSLSQQFSKMFLKEVSNTTSTKSANQDDNQKENILIKNQLQVQNNQNAEQQQPQSNNTNNAFANDKYESVLLRLKEKLGSHNFEYEQENNNQSKLTESKTQENKNKNDLSVKTSLTFNCNKQEGSRYEQALSQEMKTLPNSKRGQKKPTSLQQILQQQQVSGPMTKYKQIFLVNEQDNPKNRKLKLLHSKISELLTSEYELEIKIKILSEKIFSEYIPSLNASEETQKDLIKEFQNILYLWEMTNTHLESRQAYLEEMFEDVKQVSEVRQKLKFEQEYIENMKIPELEQQLLIMLNQRHQFKAQIDTSSESIFSFKTNKRFYNAIRNINQQIEPLVQKYSQQKKTPYIWRGINVEELLQVDKFEEELVQKEELREEIQKKVFKKF